MAPYRSGSFCAVFGCSNNKSKHKQHHFFRFPKDKDRCKRWVINCRRDDLMKKDAIYLNNNFRMCHLHFNDTQFMNGQNKERLIWNAIPTIFLSVPNPPQPLQASRKPPVHRAPPVDLRDSELSETIMEFIPTTRGGRKLLLDGYTYITDKRRENVTYWRCERKGSCGGRLKTEDDIIQGEVSNHSHPPNAGLNLSLKTVQKIKERARQSEEVTSTIIQNCTSEYPLDAAGALPKKETLARMVRRQRTAPDGDVLTNDLQKTIRGEDFVVHKRKRQPMEDTIEVMVGLQNISSFSEDLIKPECPANTGEMSMNSPDISAISAAVWRPSHETTPLNPPNPSFSTHETPPTPSEIEAKAVLDGPSLQEEYDPLFIIPEVFIKVEDRSDFEPTVIPAVTLMVEESLKPEPDMGTTIKSEID